MKTLLILSILTVVPILSFSQLKITECKTKWTASSFVDQTSKDRIQGVHEFITDSTNQVLWIQSNYRYAFTVESVDDHLAFHNLEGTITYALKHGNQQAKVTITKSASETLLHLIIFSGEKEEVNFIYTIDHVEILTEE